MSYSNVPDDWNDHWATCPRCDCRYHESDGGCDCEGYCVECGEELEEGVCPNSDCAEAGEPT